MLFNIKDKKKLRYIFLLLLITFTIIFYQKQLMSEKKV